jgi:hypothetical protein
VDENWNNSLSGLEIARVVLVSAHLTHHNRIDTFQMGRVGKDFDCDILTINVFGETGTQMVFDIA